MSDETTVFQGSPSLMTRFGALALGGLVLAGAVAGLVWIGGTSPAAQWAFGGLAIAAAVYLVAEIVIHKSTHYEVTTERIRIRTGVLNKRTDEVELYRASDTSLLEPLMQRLVGLGTIEVRTMEHANPAVLLQALRGARALRETLRSNIEICRERKRVLMMETENHHPDVLE